MPATLVHQPHPDVLAAVAQTILVKLRDRLPAIAASIHSSDTGQRYALFDLGLRHHEPLMLCPTPDRPGWELVCCETYTRLFQARTVAELGEMITPVSLVAAYYEDAMPDGLRAPPVVQTVA